MAARTRSAPEPAPAPTVAQQLAAERVLRHGAAHCRSGGFLTNDDLRALVALLDRRSRGGA